MRTGGRIKVWTASASAASVSSYPSPPASSLLRPALVSAEESSALWHWAEVSPSRALALAAVAVLVAAVEPAPALVLVWFHSRRRSG